MVFTNTNAIRSIKAAVVFRDRLLNAETIVRINDAIEDVSSATYSLRPSPTGIVAYLSFGDRPTRSDKMELRKIRQVLGTMDKKVYGKQLPSLNSTSIVELATFGDIGQKLEVNSLAEMDAFVVCDDLKTGALIADLIDGSMEVPVFEFESAQVKVSEVFDHKICDLRQNDIQVRVFKNLPRANDLETYFARSIACCILGGHPEAVLSRRLRFQSGGGYSPKTILRWLGGHQWFILDLRAGTNWASDGRERIFEIFNNLLEVSIDEREITLAYNYMQNFARRLVSSPGGSIAAETMMLDGNDPWRLHSKILTSFPAPANELVQEQLNLFLKVSDSSTLFYGPLGDVNNATVMGHGERQ